MGAEVAAAIRKEIAARDAGASGSTPTGSNGGDRGVGNVTSTPPSPPVPPPPTPGGDLFEAEDKAYIQIKGVNAPIVPGSLLFDFDGKLWFDRDGILYFDLDPATGSATEGGTVNYSNARLTFQSRTGGVPNTINFRSGLLQGAGAFRSLEAFQLTLPTAPIAPGSFQMNGTTISGRQISITTDAAGNIIEANNLAAGVVNFQSGYGEIQFGEFDEYDPVEDAVPSLPVDINSLRYNAVALKTLPVDPAILGLDPVRLPSDGRVPMFRAGEVVCIHHTGEDTLPDPFNPNDVHTLPFDRLTWVRLKDADGTYVDTVHYTADLPAGTITAAPTADFSGHTLPLVAEFRIEDISVVSDIELSGRLTLTKPVTHAFPIPGTYVSGVLVAGDMQARAFGLFDQETWTGVFSDTLIGDAVGDANYNSQLFPIEVSNIGTVKDRWALVFTNANSFDIVGEISGTVGTGTVLQDAEPNNPATGQPYFTIRAAGWGAGWAQGNVVRFNTDGANAPVWCALTVQPSDPAPGDIDFKIEFRGNAD
ncbi:MAG: hypothetical protein ABF296_09410 [Oceanococcaceae bacterium]